MPDEIAKSLGYWFEPISLTPLDYFLPVRHMIHFEFLRTASPKEEVSCLESGILRLIKHNPSLAGDVCKTSQRLGDINKCEIRPPTLQSLQSYPIVQTRQHPKLYVFHQRSHHLHPLDRDSLFRPEYCPVPPDIANVDRCPALRWQVNVFDDGIILTTCLHHWCIDGFGAFLILKELGKFCQNSDLPLPNHISLSQAAAEGRARILELATVNTDVEELKNPQIHMSSVSVAAVRTSKTTTDPSQDIISHRIILSSKTIKRLRDGCRALLNNYPESISLSEVEGVEDASKVRDNDLSENEIVSAMIWLCWVRARASAVEGGSVQSSSSKVGVSGDRKTLLSTKRQTSWDTAGVASTLVSAVDLRRILHPLVPANYIGNTLAFIPTTAPNNLASDLLMNALYAPSDTTQVTQTYIMPGISTYDLAVLADLASRIRTNNCQFDKLALESLLKDKMGRQDWQYVTHNPDYLIFSNMRSMRLDEVAFGPRLGSVVDFDIPDGREDGICWVLPTISSSREPWQIRVALKPDVLSFLVRDPLLLWAKENSETARL